jgi:hypothetical protein
MPPIRLAWTGPIQLHIRSAALPRLLLLLLLLLYELQLSYHTVTVQTKQVRKHIRKSNNTKIAVQATKTHSQYK